MGSKNFSDLDEVPDAVKTLVSMLVRNTVHLAALLKNSQYPGDES